MTERHTTLSEFILEQQRRSPGATGSLSSLLNAIRLSCKRTAALIAEGTTLAQASLPLPNFEDTPDTTRELRPAAAVALETAANTAFLRTLEAGGNLAGMLSGELDEPYAIPEAYPRGQYLIAFDPLDGSAYLDINVPTGSIFSVLRAPNGAEAAKAADFLQPGTSQVAAGYAMYGPATMIVLTVGRGVQGFTLNRALGEFLLTHRDMRIHEETRDFAVNASDARSWETPVQRYIDECVQGKTGPRGRDFNMRWTASPVAELHRTLVRGGVFMYPADTRDAAREGRLRILCEANAMAMLVEQAGGAASTGRGRLLDLTPHELHQRAPGILGSREEVERLERYHQEHDDGLDRAFTSPLFNERSLFPRR